MSQRIAITAKGRQLLADRERIDAAIELLKRARQQLEIAKATKSVEHVNRAIRSL